MLGCIGILTYPLSFSYALDVTLAWDANTEPNLAGYGIYYDTNSGPPYYGFAASEGGSPIDMPLYMDEDPDPSTVQFTLHDLPDGGYFFAVTAYNADGIESGYSNEASTSTLARQVSMGGTTGGGGGGGCFVATATCGSNEPTSVTYIFLILVTLSLGVAAILKK